MVGLCAHHGRELFHGFFRYLKQAQRPVYPATLLPEWSNDWLLMPLQRTEILKVKAPRHRMQL